MIVVDAVVRLIPGVIAENSLERESFFKGKYLEHPHYTRPEEIVIGVLNASCVPQDANRMDARIDTAKATGEDVRIVKNGEDFPHELHHGLSAT